MSALAGTSLAWLSYVALYGASGARRPSVALAQRAPWPHAMRALSLVLFAASVIAMARAEGSAGGAIMAVVAWTLAASVAPLAFAAWPRWRARSVAVAGVAALIGVGASCG